MVAFPTIHDTPEPCGYVINHPDSGNILFITDTSDDIAGAVRLPGITTAMIECNWDADTIWSNTDIPEVYRQRAVESHLSLDGAKELIRTLRRDTLRQVILIHGSANNANAPKFVREIGGAAGGGVEVMIAKPGQKYFYYLIGENDEAIEAGKYVSRYTLADAKQYVDDTLRRQEERRTEYNQLR